MSRLATTIIGVVLLGACGPGSPGETGDVNDENADEPQSDSESESDSGGAEPSCDCVELEAICTVDDDKAMHDCALPSPCGPVDGNAEAAECVLGLLVAQEPARFYYSIDGPGCGLGEETWAGWFYILGPGVGLDNECYSWWCDFANGEDAEARHYDIAEPAYFEDCIGKQASVMTGCIFNGLTKGSPVAECGG